MRLFSSPWAQPFAVDVMLDRGEAVVTVAGELDLMSADLLWHETSKLLDARRERIVVDLRKVEFIDSTGLRVLVCLQKIAERQGRRITLVPGPQQVQRIFEITATRALFDWRE